MEVTIHAPMNDCQSDNFVSHMDHHFRSDMAFDYKCIPGTRGKPTWYELGSVWDNKIGKRINKTR